MNAKQPGILKKVFQLHVLKVCLYITNLAAITMYIFVRLLFHDYNISIKEDLMNFGKTILIAVILGSVLCTIYVAVVIVHKIFSNKKETILASIGGGEERNTMSLPDDMKIAC